MEKLKTKIWKIHKNLNFSFAVEFLTVLKQDLKTNSMDIVKKCIRYYFPFKWKKKDGGSKGIQNQF